jgi:FkbM family methyltransferase
MGRVTLEWLATQNAGIETTDGELLKVRVLNDFYLWVDARDVSLTPCLVESGFWESWITVFVQDFLKPGDTFVDVGANVGYYSMLADRIVGKEGRVVAYEANPEIAKMLERTKYDNRANFVIRPVACADKTGYMTLSYPGNYTGSASVVIDFEDHAWGEPHHIEVPTVKLDDEILHNELYPNPVDLLKIDAESAEEIVWNGARKLLYGNNVPTVLLEYSPTGHYSDEWKDELFDNWDVFQINGEGAAEPVRRPYLDTLDDWSMLVLTP